MKKKNLLFLGLVALLFCGFLFYSNESKSQDVEIEIPNFDDQDWCRCKDNGCYQGNWISFRRLCGTSVPCMGAGACD